MRYLFIFLILYTSIMCASGQHKHQQNGGSIESRSDSTRTVEAPPYKGNEALTAILFKINEMQFDTPLKAIEVCDSLLNIYPKDQLITIYKMNAVLFISNKERRTNLLTSYSISESNPVILELIVNLLHNTNDFTYTLKTDDLITKLISIRGNADDFYLRGEVRTDLGEFSDALLDYNHALELSFNHNNPMILQSIAFCHKAAGDYFEAIQGFNKILETSNQKGNVIYNRGICKLELHDYSGCYHGF